MEYDDKIAHLNEEKRRLERCSLRSSVSSNLRYLYDYVSLNGLYDTLDEKFNFEFYVSPNGLKTYNKQEKSNRYNDIVFNKEYMHDGHDMHEVFSRFSNFFKDANFYDFSNPGYVQLSSRERQEIIYSYLDYLIPNGSKLFKDLRERFSCLIGAELPDSIFGETYVFYTKPENSTIFIDQCLKYTDINYMLVIIHEIIHYYTAILVKDYGNANRLGLIYSNLGEVLSVYSEFSFLEWLKKNRIHTKNAEFTYNFNLAIYYVFMERFRYYYFCLKNKRDVKIENNGVIMIPHNDLNFDSYYSLEVLKTEKGFDSSGIKYVIAFLKAFDLLDMEVNGEDMNRVFKDFLANITDKKQETRILFNEKNDDAIRKYIKDNVEECKRLYKFK